MLNEEQLSNLLVSISNRIGSNLNYLPIVSSIKRREMNYIKVTESGYSLYSEEKGHIDFEEHNLNLEDLIYKVFLLISYDMFGERYRRGDGSDMHDESVSMQRVRRFQYQIEFLGRIDQSYSKRRTEEIEKIKEKYPL